MADKDERSELIEALQSIVHPAHIDHTPVMLWGRIADFILARDQATRKETIEEALAAGPEDPPKTHSGLITAFTLAQAKEENNKQWRSALRALREYDLELVAGVEGVDHGK